MTGEKKTGPFPFNNHVSKKSIKRGEYFGFFTGIIIFAIKSCISYTVQYFNGAGTTGVILLSPQAPSHIRTTNSGAAHEHKTYEKAILASGLEVRRGRRRRRNGV
jgi:hypothetical protein